MTNLDDCLPARVLNAFRAAWPRRIYNEHHFFVANTINCFSVGTKNKDLKLSDDGSLTIYVQAEPPSDLAFNASTGRQRQRVTSPCTCEPIGQNLRSQMVRGNHLRCRGSINFEVRFWEGWATAMASGCSKKWILALTMSYSHSPSSPDLHHTRASVHFSRSGIRTLTTTDWLPNAGIAPSSDRTAPCPTPRFSATDRSPASNA